MILLVLLASLWPYLVRSIHRLWVHAGRGNWAQLGYAHGPHLGLILAGIAAAFFFVGYGWECWRMNAR